MTPRHGGVRIVLPGDDAYDVPADDDPAYDPSLAPDWMQLADSRQVTGLDDIPEGAGS